MTFVKGQSGNSRGRPKRGSTLTDFLRFSLAQPISEADRRTRAEQWAETFVRQALEGDTAASKAILDRLDGPVRTEISGPAGGAITIDVLREAIRDAYPER